MATSRRKAAAPPKFQQDILELYSSKNDATLLFHNYKHTVDTYQKVMELAKLTRASAETKDIASSAAWFLDVGYLLDYQKGIEQGCDIAKVILKKKRYSKAKTDQILKAIRTIGLNGNAETKAERLLSDAVNAVDYDVDFRLKSSLLRGEKEFHLGVKYDRKEWLEVELEKLKTAKYYSEHAKLNAAPKLATHIQATRDALDKINRRANANVSAISITEEVEELGAYDQLEEGVPERAIQTFFRSNFRNHINLSAIADNKANIMISVNAIIISMLITILTYQEFTDSRPMILFPIVIFVVTGLTSLTFAVLSARPKVTSVLNVNPSIEKAKYNLSFFGNFVQLKLPQYEKAMDEMFRSSSLIYGNMTRDLYHLGLVLDKKYHYLRYSYSIFMIGFVATVLTFMVAFFT